MAAKGKDGVAALTNVASRGKDRLARLHAIWGLGQIGRSDGAVHAGLVPLLTDVDAEVRAQAAKMLGDGKEMQAFDGLVKLLSDNEPRVRFFAAIALGKLGREQACEPVLAMLKENADADAYIRHAGVMALTALYDPAAPRQPKQTGRPRIKGKRRPTLAQVLADPQTVWTKLEIEDWYGEGKREVEVCSATAVWYHTGKDPVEIR